MIPINDYQKTLYAKLKETGYKVFDEVPTDESLPLVTLGEYSFSSGSVKNECYIFIQDIEIYSEYEGKKEINEMVSVIIEKLEGLVSANITDTFFISDINIDSCTVRRSDDLYIANLKIKIEIEVE
jgi:hypothetical protein